MPASVNRNKLISDALALSKTPVQEQISFDLDSISLAPLSRVAVSTKIIPFSSLFSNLSVFFSTSETTFISSLRITLKIIEIDSEGTPSTTAVLSNVPITDLSPELDGYRGTIITLDGTEDVYNDLFRASSYLVLELSNASATDTVTFSGSISAVFYALNLTNEALISLDGPGSASVTDPDTELPAQLVIRKIVNSIVAVDNVESPECTIHFYIRNAEGFREVVDNFTPIDLITAIDRGYPADLVADRYFIPTTELSGLLYATQKDPAGNESPISAFKLVSFETLVPLATPVVTEVANKISVSSTDTGVTFLFYARIETDYFPITEDIEGTAATGFRLKSDSYLYTFGTTTPTSKTVTLPIAVKTLKGASVSSLSDPVNVTFISAINVAPFLIVEGDKRPEVNYDTLTLNFSEPVFPADRSVIDKNCFKIFVGSSSTPLPITAFTATSGSTTDSLKLVLATPVRASATTVRIAIEPTSSANCLADSDGTKILVRTATPALNVTPNTYEPVVVSTEVSGSSLVITFDKDCTLVGNTDTTKTRFTVTQSFSSGGATYSDIYAVASVAVNLNKVTLVLERNIRQGAAVTLSFRDTTSLSTSAATIKDVFGNEVKSFTILSVTNNTPALAAGITNLYRARVRASVGGVSADGQVEFIPASSGPTAAFNGVFGGVNNIYGINGTDWSQAVIHAGLLAPGEEGIIEFNVLTDLLSSVVGTLKNEITSKSLSSATLNIPATKFTLLEKTDIDSLSPAPVTVKMLSVGKINIKFNKTLKTSSKPPASEFKVRFKATGEILAITAGPMFETGSSDEITFWFDRSQVRSPANLVTVEYTKTLSGADTLVDYTGKTVSSFGPFDAEALFTDIEVPLLKSNPKEQGSSILMEYDEPLAATTVNPSSFTLTTTSTQSISVTGVTVSANQVLLTLSRQIVAAEFLRLSYRQPSDGANAIKDLAGNLAPAFSLDVNNLQKPVITYGGAQPAITVSNVAPNATANIYEVVGGTNILLSDPEITEIEQIKLLEGVKNVFTAFGSINKTTKTVFARCKFDGTRTVDSVSQSVTFNLPAPTLTSVYTVNSSTLSLNFSTGIHHKVGTYQVTYVNPLLGTGRVIADVITPTTGDIEGVGFNTLLVRLVNPLPGNATQLKIKVIEPPTNFYYVPFESFDSVVAFTVPPQVVSTTIAGSSVEVIFDQELDRTQTIDLTKLSLSSSQPAIVSSEILFNSDDSLYSKLKLKLAGKANATAATSFVYQTGGNIKNLNGVELAPVTNNVLTFNAESLGTTTTVYFNKTLDPTSIPSGTARSSYAIASISGTTVSFTTPKQVPGTEFSLSYTNKPIASSSTKLKFLDGSEVPAFSTTVFVADSLVISKGFNKRYGDVLIVDSFTDAAKVKLYDLLTSPATNLTSKFTAVSTVGGITFNPADDIIGQSLNLVARVSNPSLSYESNNSNNLETKFEVKVILPTVNTETYLTALSGTLLSLAFKARLDIDYFNANKNPSAFVLSYKTGDPAEPAGMSTVEVSPTAITLLPEDTKVLNLTLASALPSDASEIKLAYRPDSNNFLRDYLTNTVDPFEALSIARRDPDVVTPTFQTSELDDQTLTIVMSENVVMGTVTGPEFVVNLPNGTTVAGTSLEELGGVITVTLASRVPAGVDEATFTYTAPANGIQDPSGNKVPTTANVEITTIVAAPTLTVVGNTIEVTNAAAGITLTPVSSLVIESRAAGTAEAFTSTVTQNFILTYDSANSKYVATPKPGLFTGAALDYRAQVVFGGIGNYSNTVTASFDSSTPGVSEAKIIGTATDLNTSTLSLTFNRLLGTPLPAASGFRVFYSDSAGSYVDGVSLTSSEVTVSGKQVTKLLITLSNNVPVGTTATAKTLVGTVIKDSLGNQLTALEVNAAVETYVFAEAQNRSVTEGGVTTQLSNNLLLKNISLVATIANIKIWDTSLSAATALDTDYVDVTSNFDIVRDDLNYVATPKINTYSNETKAFKVSYAGALRKSSAVTAAFDTTRPAISSSSLPYIASNTVYLTFNKNLHALSGDLASRFTVSSSRGSFTTSNFAVTGNRLSFTISPNPGDSEVFTISYADLTSADDATGVIQSLNFKVDAASFSTSVTAPTFPKPELDTSISTKITKNIVILNFTQELDTPTEATASRFTITGTKTSSFTVSNFFASGKALTFELSPLPKEEETITIAYVDPTAGSDSNTIKSTNLADAPSFTTSVATGKAATLPNSLVNLSKVTIGIPSRNSTYEDYSIASDKTKWVAMVNKNAPVAYSQILSANTSSATWTVNSAKGQSISLEEQDVNSRVISVGNYWYINTRSEDPTKHFARVSKSSPNSDWSYVTTSYTGLDPAFTAASISTIKNSATVGSNTVICMTSKGPGYLNSNLSYRVAVLVSNDSGETWTAKNIASFITTPSDYKGEIIDCAVAASSEKFVLTALVTRVRYDLSPQTREFDLVTFESLDAITWTQLSVKQVASMTYDSELQVYSSDTLKLLYSEGQLILFFSAPGLALSVVRSPNGKQWSTAETVTFSPAVEDSPYGNSLTRRNLYSLGYGKLISTNAYTKTKISVSEDFGKTWTSKSLFLEPEAFATEYAVRELELMDIQFDGADTLAICRSRDTAYFSDWQIVIGKLVTNTTPPVIDTANPTTISANTVTINFDRKLATVTSSLSTKFSVTGTSTATFSTNTFAVSSKALSFKLSPSPAPGETVTITYSAPTTTTDTNAIRSLNYLVNAANFTQSVAIPALPPDVNTLEAGINFSNPKLVEVASFSPSITNTTSREATVQYSKFSLIATNSKWLANVAKAYYDADFADFRLFKSQSMYSSSLQTSSTWTTNSEYVHSVSGSYLEPNAMVATGSSLITSPLQWTGTTIFNAPSSSNQPVWSPVTVDMTGIPTSPDQDLFVPTVKNSAVLGNLAVTVAIREFSTIYTLGRLEGGVTYFSYYRTVLLVSNDQGATWSAKSLANFITPSYTNYTLESISVHAAENKIVAAALLSKIDGSLEKFDVAILETTDGITWTQKAIVNFLNITYSAGRNRWEKPLKYIDLTYTGGKWVVLARATGTITASSNVWYTSKTNDLSTWPTFVAASVATSGVRPQIEISSIVSAGAGKLFALEENNETLNNVLYSDDYGLTWNFLNLTLQLSPGNSSYTQVMIKDIVSSGSEIAVIATSNYGTNTQYASGYWKVFVGKIV